MPENVSKCRNFEKSEKNDPESTFEGHSSLLETTRFDISLWYHISLAFPDVARHWSKIAILSCPNCILRVPIAFCAAS